MSGTNLSPEKPNTVAIIGCGPGGMFLLHTLATKRKELTQKGDTEALSKLPIVTCFERSSLPGGVWRSERDSQAVSTNMYDGLWINAGKEAFEFFDYTFDEHFKCPQPSFLPRKDCLEYIIARVTQHEDIFQHVQFSTTVTKVTYDDEIQKFAITRSHDGTSTTSHFDKCVWAGGVNGKPRMIPSILENLEGFTGEILHSSEMNRLESRISNKRILMIGGSYSSEDLALQCTKLGAGEIYITSRSNEGDVSFMGSWPNDNVKVLEYRVPSGIKNGTGNTILCRTTYYDEDESDEESESDDDDSFDEPDIVEVKDVDVIVFCTGYLPNADFLDPSLNPFLGEKDIPTWRLPKNWKMKPNMLTAALGHVKPSKKLRGWCNDMYYGEDKLHGPLLIRNPKMMFVFESWFDTPLYEIDVNCYECIGYIIGELDIPSEEEMKESYRNDLVLAMDTFEGRIEIDKKYEEAVYEWLPRDHFFVRFLKDKVITEEMKDFLKENIQNSFVEFFACKNYPVKLGTLEGGFNDKGKLHLEYEFENVMAHLNLKKYKGKEEAKWITFRDILHPSPSMFTGTKPIPLKGRWMDLDNDGNVAMVPTVEKGDDEKKE